MALFKCKMCGGDLEILEGVTVAECEYCGTKQAVPKAMDENLQNLFNRANTLRIKSEFDKAEKLYEKIIQADTTQSDAYWGLILCKYGIEYVDDPATFKKIPTCHRASYDSIIADDDYKSAIEHADISQRAIYEEQAREIDRIQKEILALAQKEETYDVFICYKETDANGQRTQDSVIANDIYYQLTNEGFKVFYAAITLEGKLGSAYEPIIFAALNSAKVMLAIGTKPEHFNAVWVKNEWSRFLKIIKKDRSKLLIPCYRDFDAYELPEEFAHLQAQDMSKIGFINDVVRGIKKVLTKDEPKTAVVKETVVTNASTTNIAPLLERAFMFLEDGEWDSANEYCEKVLDIDPKCAEAYLGKLMAENRSRTRETLKNCAEPFDKSNNYKKALRFANTELKSHLISCIGFIVSRNNEKRYRNANHAMNTAETEEDYINAAQLFDAISDYKDSGKLAEECRKSAQLKYSDLQAKLEEERIKNEYIEELKRIAEELELNQKKKNDLEEQLKECEKEIKMHTTSFIAVKILTPLMLASYAVLAFSLFFMHSEDKATFSGLSGFLGIFFTFFTVILTSGEGLDLYHPFKSYKKVISNKEEKKTQLTQELNEVNSRLNNVREFDIQDGVTTIDQDMFKGCMNLTSITIPDSVTEIGNGVFANCPRLENIKFNGTKAQWCAIQKGYNWDYNTGNYTVYCTDGTISK